MNSNAAISLQTDLTLARTELASAHARIATLERDARRTSMLLDLLAAELEEALAFRAAPLPCAATPQPPSP